MSLSWTDCKGKAWPCKITYGSVDDVRDAMTIDLLTIADDEGALFKEIRTKKAMLTNVMYCLAVSNGETATEKEFHRGIDGDSFADMDNAFVEAILDFTPPDLRAALRGMVEKTNAMKEKAILRFVKSVENLNLDAVVENMGAKADQRMISAVAKLTDAG